VAKLASPLSAGGLLRGVAAAAAAFGVALAVQAATPADGLQLLTELGERLRSQPVWTATYRQEYVAAGMASGERAAGTVWLGWPDRALFVTGEPPIRVMGLEGRHVRLLDHEMSTCEEHELTDEEWQRVPLMAVLDPTTAVERFFVASPAPRRLTLAPRRPGGVARVEVQLGDDGLPVVVTVIDPQGARNRFDFRGWHGAKGPPKGEWLPAPMKGMVCEELDDRSPDPG